MKALISIGGARLQLIGLRPARIVRSGEARFVAAPTWYDVDHQATGRGEQITTIDAETMPHVFGGLDALALLELHRDQNRPVQLIRMGRNFLASVAGLVGVRHVESEEERLHPFDGVGRIVRVHVELVHLSSIGRGFGGFS